AAAQADIVVLVSGDGDFAILVDKIRQGHGKTVEVYGVPKLTAKALMDAANRFIAIDEALLLG
ncbi:MAG: uncharacterized LabA/DUF88 family protein, partial [Granulosicoccus sp.]